MKTRVLTLSACIIFFAVCVFAREGSIIKVDKIQICVSVEDREPVGTGQNFTEDVYRLYCFTSLRSNQDNTSISHVWYYNDKEMSNVELGIHAKTWRTWSSKRILKGWTGEWRVDVLSHLGEVLASKEFRIYQQVEPVQEYVPEVGQGGKDVVWVPTSQVLVDEMIDIAKVTPEDYVIDLGSGDGRIVITAAKLGARALGIEYNPYMVELSRQNAAEEGVSDKATFAEADIFKTDFSEATVITMFLLDELNYKLRPKILDLKPGTRIVSNTFDMGEWNADKVVTVDNDDCFRYCTAYLWIVPAKVGGTWELPQGELTLEQNFQMITGTLRSGRETAPIDGKMIGDQISFTADGRQYTGMVRGDEMEVETNDGRNTRWSAIRSVR
ncbi:DUF2914 domain-containing protein [Deltaproteobacteria bacterium]|nr:DUF2914 domain-containing protein [Deltaproteobacteria bacterium]